MRHYMNRAYGHFDFCNDLKSPSLKSLCILNLTGIGDTTMPLPEADTGAKLIDPALYARGWKEDNLKREETAGAGEVERELIL